jgi:hypothetical protein
LNASINVKNRLLIQEELEESRRRDENLRKELVDQLVAEHRNRTLEELSRFGDSKFIYIKFNIRQKTLNEAI